MNTLTSRSSLCALLSTALLVGVACEEPPPPSTGLPGGLDIAGLSPQHRALLRVTLQISESALAETDLTLSEDFQSVSGTFDVQDVTAAKDAEMTLRVYGRFSAESAEVVLGELKKPLRLEPNADVAIDFGSDDTFETCGAGRDGRCSLLFDSNRNGATNIADLLERTRSAAGIDPAPQAPFLVTSPEQLQFPSGIRLGTFARQLVVLENFGQNPITISSAAVVGGQGFAISILDPTGLSVAPPSRALESDDFRTIAPGQEAFLAVSFAPVNSFVTTGALFVKVVDQVTLVEQTARVKLIANPEGELRPADPTYVEPDLSDVNVTSGTVQVIAFPNAQLQSGDALIAEDAFGAGLRQTGNILDIGAGDDAIAFPADAAFAVDVRPGERFSTTLDGLESDIDVAVVSLNGTSISGLACDTCLSRNAGLSPEAVELRNDSEETVRVLVVLGRVEAEPAPAATEGGLAAAETVGFRCASTVSIGPEFDAEQPIAPTTGPLEGGIPVTLRGTGFDPRARVFVGAAEALDVAIEATEDGTDVITFTLPAAVGTENPASIIVENPADGGDGQAATLLEAFTYQPPAPVIDEIRPDVAPTTGGTTNMTVIGRFFSARFGPPQVSFGTVTVDATFVSASELTLLAPAHISATTAATVSVKVRNRLAPDVGGAPTLGSASNGLAFRYVVPSDTAPVLTAVNPSSGSIDGGTQVTLTGTGFRSGLEIFFNGREATCDEPTDSSVLCRTPQADGPGLVDVIIVNDDGQSSKLDVAYSYIIPPPSITSVFPARGNRDGGTLIVVEGGGFRPGARAAFVQGANTRPAAAATRVSGTTMLVTTPVADAGAAELQITNLDGQTVSTTFTFFAPEEATPPPSIASLAPSVGDASGGFPVVITGTGFLNPSVLFGSVQLSGEQVTFIDRAAPALDEITVVAPPSPTGVAAAVNVQVINDDGQSTSAGFNYTFTAAAAPRIDRVEPSTFNANQQLSFTVTGARFDAGARILVGGIVANITTRSSTSLQATVPGQGFPNAGSVLVVVENPNGDNVNAPISIVAPTPPPVVVNPVVSAVSTEDVHAAVAGDVITIFGSGFDQGPVTVTTAAPEQGPVALPARVVSATATTVTVELPALPVGTNRLTVSVETAQGPRVALTPPLAVRAPVVILADQEGDGAGNSGLLMIGDFFNPNRLTAVDLVAASGFEVSCSNIQATETFLRCSILGQVPPALLLTPRITWTGTIGGVPQAPTIRSGAEIGFNNPISSGPVELSSQAPIAGSTDFAEVQQEMTLDAPGIAAADFPAPVQVQGFGPNGQMSGTGIVGDDVIVVTWESGGSEAVFFGSFVDVQVTGGGAFIGFGSIPIVDRRVLENEFKVLEWRDGFSAQGVRLPGDESRVVALRQTSDGGFVTRTLLASVTGDELSAVDTAILAPGPWQLCFSDQVPDCLQNNSGSPIFINGATGELNEGQRTGIDPSAEIANAIPGDNTDHYFFFFDSPPSEGGADVVLNAECPPGMTARLLDDQDNELKDLCDPQALPVALPTGEYDVVIIRDPPADEPVPYSLRISSRGEPEPEPDVDGNTLATPTAVTPPSTESVSLGTLGDQDCFAVTLAARQVIFAETSDGAAGCPADLDTVIELFSGGTEIASNDDGGADLCSQLVSLQEPGDYVICVRSFRTDDTGDMTLEIRLDAPGGCNLNGIVDPGEACDEGFDAGFCDAACNEPDEADDGQGGADIGAAPTSVDRTLVTDDLDQIFFTSLAGEFRVRVVPRDGPCSTLQDAFVNGVPLARSLDGCVDDLVVLNEGPALVELTANTGAPLKYTFIVDSGVVGTNPTPIDPNGAEYAVFLSTVESNNFLVVAQDIDGTAGNVVDAIFLDEQSIVIGNPSQLAPGTAAFCVTTTPPSPGTQTYASFCRSPVFFETVSGGGGEPNCQFFDLTTPDGPFSFPGGLGTFDGGYIPGNRQQFLSTIDLDPPLHVEVDVNFADNNQIAFVGTRYSGAPTAPNAEVDNLAYTRFHAGGDEQIDVTFRENGTFSPQPLPQMFFTGAGGDSVVPGREYRVIIDDDGEQFAVTVIDSVTLEEVTTSILDTRSFGQAVVLQADLARFSDLQLCSPTLAAP